MHPVNMAAPCDLNVSAVGGCYPEDFILQAVKCQLSFFYCIVSFLGVAFIYFLLNISLFCSTYKISYKLQWIQSLQLDDSVCETNFLY